MVFPPGQVKIFIKPIDKVCLYDYNKTYRDGMFKISMAKASQFIRRDKRLTNILCRSVKNKNLTSAGAPQNGDVVRRRGEDT